MKPRIHTKIQEKLYSLEYAKHLQTRSLSLQMGLAIELAFLGAIVTSLLQCQSLEPQHLTLLLLNGTGIIFTVSFVFFILARRECLTTLKRIRALNPSQL